MDFSKLIVVSGKSGVFRVISQGRSGFIVESLVDGKKMPIPLNYRSTSLKDIVVFTETDEVPLLKVFNKIKQHTQAQQAISHKENEQQIRSFFEKVLPDYDRTRVHLSDMRKIIQWYNILQQHGILEFEEETSDDVKDTTGKHSDAEENKLISDDVSTSDNDKSKVQKHDEVAQLSLFEADNPATPQQKKVTKSTKKTSSKKSDSSDSDEKEKK